jgi:hypothetical protein
MDSGRLSADYAGFRDAAVAIFERYDGDDAVSAFGLADVFAHDNDHAPAYAFLEAQGYAGTSTSALSALALAGTAAPASLLLAVPFGHGGLLGVAGLTPDAAIAVDRAGDGLVSLVDAEVVPHGSDPADDHVTVLAGGGPGEVLIAEADLATYRGDIVARVRLGLGGELLGIADRLLEEAVAYARTRRQFGHSIGDYQAVQHLLAWSATELHQLRSLYDIAVLRQATVGVDLAMATAVKAVAGRVLLTIAQTAIQVTGAISFTWEYALNRRHHRGLALDQLGGPSADLITEMGRLVRTTGLVPPLFELADLAT